MKKYAKAVVAVAGVVIVAAQGLSDGSLNTDEIVAIAAAVGVALGVFGVRNVPYVEPGNANPPAA